MCKDDFAFHAQDSCSCTSPRSLHGCSSWTSSRARLVEPVVVPQVQFLDKLTCLCCTLAGFMVQTVFTLSGGVAVAALDTVVDIPVVAPGNPIDKVVDVPSHAGNFWGPAHRCRAEGVMSLWRPPIIRCISWLARRDLFVIHTVRTTTTTTPLSPPSPSHTPPPPPPPPPP